MAERTSGGINKKGREISGGTLKWIPWTEDMESWAETNGRGKPDFPGPRRSTPPKGHESTQIGQKPRADFP